MAPRYQALIIGGFGMGVVAMTVALAGPAGLALLPFVFAELAHAMFGHPPSSGSEPSSDGENDGSGGVDMVLRSVADESRSDSDLVAAARLGDDSAWAALAARHAERLATLCGHLAAISDYRIEQDDLYQEVWAKVQRCIADTTEPIASFSGYLATAAANRVKDEREKWWKRRTDPLDPASMLSVEPVEDPQLPDLDLEAWRAAARTPQELVLVWYLEQGAGLPEIAHQLQFMFPDEKWTSVTVRTARERIKRNRGASLRRAVQEDER